MAIGVVIPEDSTGLSTFAGIAQARGVTQDDFLAVFAGIAQARGVAPYQLTRWTASPQRTQKWTG